MLRNEIAESYSFVVFALFFKFFFEDSPCLFPEWLCWRSCPPIVNEKPSFPQPPQPSLSVAVILVILTGVWWNLKVALIWIPLLIKNDEYSHAIKACSLVPPQDGGTLLCYRGEVQGPLSRVLLMVKRKVSSLLCCRWSGARGSGGISGHENLIAGLLHTSAMWWWELGKDASPLH